MANDLIGQQYLRAQAVEVAEEIQRMSNARANSGALHTLTLVLQFVTYTMRHLTFLKRLPKDRQEELLGHNPKT